MHVRLRIATAGALLASAAIGLAACGPSTVPAAPQGAGAMHRQRAVLAYAAWRDSLTRTQLPGAGCFEAHYPSTGWIRVACSTEPDASTAAPRQLPGAPDNIGGGNGQIEAMILSPALIKGAIGSFPSVKGVKAEHSVPKNGGASLGPNTFSLQLNSNTFSTAACGPNVGCKGWEQFVFGNNPPSRHVPTRILVQDWLVATAGKPLTCPKKWNHSGNSCFVNGPRTLDVPYQSIKNLANISLQGESDLKGDGVFLTIGKTSYAVRNAQSDSMTDLAYHWSDVQFNVLGDAGSSIATFNPGATVAVQIQVDTGNPLVAPLCVLDRSTTGESNTLNYSAAPTPQPATYPSIVFAESNAPNGGNASCSVAGAATP